MLAVGMRVLAASLFVAASFALLLIALPRGEAKSYSRAPTDDIDFGVRWPNLGNSSDPIMTKALFAHHSRQSTGSVQTVSAKSTATSREQRDALFGALTSASLNWTGDYSAAQRTSSGDPVQRAKTTRSPHASLQRQDGAEPGGARSIAKTELARFSTAPFPYDGVVPTTNEPFLNVVEAGEKGHRSSRGRVLWEEQTFSDNRVLLHIPSGFDINKPAVIVVFFHGHHAELTRDVLQRQQVPYQVSMSGVNAVLVAPQFAVDAADSSPGRFWQPGAFARFVGEAGKKLAHLYGDSAKARQFEKMPVVIVAYSGGYLPAAWSIQHGGLGRRLHGLVLLDALYGELDTFVQWKKRHPSVFLVSAYTESTSRHNLEFARLLNKEKIPYGTTLENHLWRGRVALLAADSDTKHRDFVTRAWAEEPIRDVLSKLN